MNLLFFCNLQTSDNPNFSTKPTKIENLDLIRHELNKERRKEQLMAQWGNLARATEDKKPMKKEIPQKPHK
jgi:hypothetical protein